MTIKKLYIVKDDNVIVSRRLEERLNIIETPHPQVVDDVLRNLLGLPTCPRTETGEWQAMAFVDDGDWYSVHMCQAEWYARVGLEVHMEVFSEDGFDCSADFLRGTREGSGEDGDVCFEEFSKRRYPHRLDEWNGDARSKSYRREFIRSFKPVRLREDKPYCFSLTDDGSFVVTQEGTGEEINLSETDALLYHLRCMMVCVEFLSGLRTAQGVETTEKPLVINGVLERLDDALDLQPFFDIMESCNRQTLLIVRKKGE